MAVGPLGEAASDLDLGLHQVITIGQAVHHAERIQQLGYNTARVKLIA